MIKIRIDLLICGAAKPTPLAVYIVSCMSAISCDKLGWSSEISLHFSLRTVEPKASIGRIMFYKMLSIMSSTEIPSASAL